MTEYLGWDDYIKIHPRKTPTKGMKCANCKGENVIINEDRKSTYCPDCSLVWGYYEK